MSSLKICVCQPFISPAWDSQLVIFSDSTSTVVQETDAKAYLSKACKYAAKFKVYLVPERFNVLGLDSACLIDPEGKVVTAQQEIFTKNKSSDLKNTSLNTFRTPLGTVALFVNDDVSHPEVPRIAFNKGTNLAISIQTIGHNDNLNHKIISGCWSASQNNNLFCVGISNRFSCVCAPKSLTNKKDGFLVQPNNLDMVAIMSTDLLDNLPPRTFLSRKVYYLHRENIIGSADL